MPAANGSKAGSFRCIYGKCGIGIAPEKAIIAFVV
jgi:hypothetical protein